MDNKKIIPLPEAEEIEKKAAYWLMRLRDDDLPKEELNKFQKWIKANDAHKKAYERLSSLWLDMDVFADLNDMACSDINHVVNRANRFSMPLKTLFGALAACFVIATISMVLFLSPNNANTQFKQNHVTQIGAHKTIGLPDGSTIILNSDTRIDIYYTSKSRKVILEYGEAFFEVVPDKKRPFSVQTKQGLITAVGTAFSVRVLSGKIDVVVTEGRVKLSAPHTAAAIKEAPSPASAPPLIPTPSATIEVSAGQTVRFAQKVESINPIDSASIERELDWRDGILAFKGDTLEQVVANISRYTELDIEIEGEELRLQPISGYFKLGETKALFDALKIIADIDVEYTEKNRVKLYRNK